MGGLKGQGQRHNRGRAFQTPLLGASQETGPRGLATLLSGPDPSLVLMQPVLWGLLPSPLLSQALPFSLPLCLPVSQH